MAVAYIGLGSNVGNRDKNLERAIDNLTKEEGIELLRVSSIYETEPVGYENQEDFLNAVVEIETHLDPHELLSVTKSIEAKQKRVRTVHWGPRTIDLDILLYDDVVLSEPRLRLPHPEVSNRAFVLVPLADLAPERELANGMSVRETLSRLGSNERVKLHRGQTDNGTHNK